MTDVRPLDPSLCATSELLNLGAGNLLSKSLVTRSAANRNNEDEVAE